MKKNKILQIASVLLIAVMLSTCAISGTFAKYVTTADMSDSARVAKWGVKITATSDQAFKKVYTAEDSATQITNAVESQDYVVAPGTSGNLATVTLSGTPEVAVAVTYAIELELSKWALEDSTEYCPLVITVGQTDYKIDSTTITDINALKTAVATAVANYNKEYAPGTDLSQKTSDAPSVSWKWAFDNSNDTNDTYLGDQAAANNAPTISIKLTITVTQIN